MPLEESDPEKEYELFVTAARIFEKLVGVRESPYLTQSRFSQISRLPGMVGGVLTRPDYDIIFTNFMSRVGGKSMYMEIFFDAMAVLGARLNPGSENEYQSMLSMIRMLRPLLAAK